MSTATLRDVLEERLAAVDPPLGDLDRARRTGRSIRRRRRAATGVCVVAAIAAAGVTVTQLTDPGSGAREEPEYAALGALDFSNGARAYADPGGKVYLGGRDFPGTDLDYLDTDAVATSQGVVFFDDGRPMILAADGNVSALVDGPVDSSEGFHPTAKADAAAPQVAWATLRDGTATIAVQDLTSREVVASIELQCGSCDGLVIDAIDAGVVFVRTADGTRAWDSARGEWRDFAGPETRVADVRSGVVLYDGPRPTGAGDWRLVEGAIDAQLTFDGAHVLYWSGRLEPTDPAGSAIVLEVASHQANTFAGFFNVDTDGSILVAHPARRGDYTVSDCELPTGACTELGPLAPTGGDPMFIGNDM